MSSYDAALFDYDQTGLCLIHYRDPVMRSVVATIFRGAVRLLIFSLFSAIFLNAGGAAELSPSELRPLAARLFDSPPLQITVGPVKGEPPAQGVFRNGHLIGYLASTWTIARSVGYSGKPIHTLMGVDENAKVTGVRLVKHSEPIVLVGIPESKIAAVTEKYAGLDLITEAAAGGSAHDLDIVSGATVTIIVMLASFWPAWQAAHKEPAESLHQV